MQSMQAEVRGGGGCVIVGVVGMALGGAGVGCFVTFTPVAAPAWVKAMKRVPEGRKAVAGVVGPPPVADWESPVLRLLFSLLRHPSVACAAPQRGGPPSIALRPRGGRGKQE
jgi:hypothetical protein